MLRGKWVADRPAQRAPTAAACGCACMETREEGYPRSIRERMEAHRMNPALAPVAMRAWYPLGFSLENYDALGKWRTESDGVPVEVAASLPNGFRFEGPSGLRALLVSHSDDFVRDFHRTTLELRTWACSRILRSARDQADRQREASAQDNRWSALITAVVRSTPFTHGIVQDVDSDARQREIVQPGR